MKNKSSFYRPRNRRKFLNTTIDFIEQQNLCKLRNYKTNLRKEDLQLLKELKYDKSFGIKDANKGRDVVIMDSVHYERMIYKQLKEKKSCHK